MEDPKLQASLTEALSSIDPIATAEEALGKRWEQWTDEEQLAALQSIFSFNQMRQMIEEKSGDTHFGSTVERAEKMMQTMGFQVGYRQSRHSKNTGMIETETFWCRPDGLIIYLDTYRATSPNRFEIYGEFKRFDDDKEFEEQYHKVSRICSSGGSYGLFPHDWTTDLKNKNISFEADVRSGLKWKMELIESNGPLISVWNDVDRHMWFINHDEEKGMDEDYRAIGLNKVRQSGTPMLKAILANVLAK